MALKTNRTDIDVKINSIEDAKKYDGYNGKTLDNDSEKNLFDDPKLKKKKPDGTLEDDLDKIRDTAELLSVWKESKDKVRNETLGLTVDGHLLLRVLLVNQKAESAPYQVVNGSNKVVDKVISQFEDILFAESEPEFLRKEETALIKVTELEEKLREVDKEIVKLRENYNQELITAQAKLENNVAAAVTALKNDLKTPGVGGRKFFELVLKYANISTDVKYKSTTPATANTFGSIIKTGYTKNHKPNTHPVFLRNDFPAQIWKVLKEIDKTKLFKYVDSSDCTWDAGKKKEFKEAFSRTWDLKLKLYNFGDKDVMIRSQQEDLDRMVPWNLSDIFYIMHALFPKGSSYKDSPFLKEDENSCLPFNDTDKNLDTRYSLFWRGEDDSIIGKNYSETSPSLLRAPFPCEVKHLTWKGGQIPEFFWQVYNSDEAIDFSAKRLIMGADAVEDSELIKDKISVYEKKLLLTINLEIFDYFFPGNVHKLSANYRKYTENLLKGLGLFTEEELTSLGSEWGSLAEKMLKDFSNKLNSTFAKQKKSLSYDQIKNSIKLFDENIVKLIEGYPGDKVVDRVTDDEVANKWEQWNTDTKAKRKVLESNEKLLADKLIEQADINSKLHKAQLEFADAKNLEKTAKEGRMQGLKDTFKEINAKTRKSWRERMFLRSILGLVGKWETDYPDLYPVNLATFDVGALRTALNSEEKIIMGRLKVYSDWESLGNNFTERLENWKKNDGKFFSEEGKKRYLEDVKRSLEAVDADELNPVEKNELEQIINHLKEVPIPTDKRITISELKKALGLGINVFSDTAQEWINFKSSIDFKKDANEIKKLADKVNGTSAKIGKSDFVKYLKETLSKKSGMTEVPKDSDGDKTWLDWFFTRSPNIVIETIASQELAVDSELKDKIVKEMKDHKDGDKVLDDSKYKKNDKGEFTDEAITKFYYEKLAGQNYSTKKKYTPKDTPDNSDVFWRWDNPYALATGGGLLLLGGLIIYAIVRWDKVVAWWNGPADAEGNGDLEESDE